MAANPAPSIPKGAGARSFAECLAVVEQAREALAGVRAVTWQATGRDLAAALGAIGELVLIADAAEVAVLADALERGEHNTGEWPLPATEWVVQQSRRYPSGRAASPLVKLAQQIRTADLTDVSDVTDPGADTADPAAGTDAATANGDGDGDGNGAEVGADQNGSDQDGTDRNGWARGACDAGNGTLTGSGLPRCLREGVLTGAVPRPAAGAVVAEMTRLLPKLVPDAVPVVWQAYTDLAATVGDPGEVRRLRPRLLAAHGRPEDTARDEHHARGRAVLSHGFDGGDGLTDYRMSLDPEAAAILESALSPLSGPRHGPDGDLDTRPAATRRAHVLIELVTRAVGADRQAPGRGSTHTTLIVTADDLAAETGGAITAGTVDAGRFLSIETARKAACGGHVTPVVLNKAGNPVVIGHTHRLFTREQTIALLVRDTGCTFPGCTRPAGWSDAHHLIHWADGGPTDLTNATLVCRFHHTIVHTRRLAGKLTTGPPGTPDEERLRVVWDLTPGSYDILLRARRAGDPTVA